MSPSIDIDYLLIYEERLNKKWKCGVEEYFSSRKHVNQNEHGHKTLDCLFIVIDFR